MTPYLEGLLHDISCSHGFQLLVLLQPGLEAHLDLITLLKDKKPYVFQDYPWDYNLLSNVSLFLGNLTVALTFGLVFCIGMELPLAKLQKIIIGAFVTRMTKGQKWTLPVFLIFIAVILFMVANALAKLWKKDLIGDLGLRVSEW